ncbi:MAG: alpha/beta fold hydrolase [Betaproteobacteria bacterium]|nr:alpha/beta fold hydrolase [Betaproteobacteria bacterium]
MPTVTANGISLAYEVAGDPGSPALVLIMGLGMPLVFWPDAFVDGLVNAGFRVVRLDNRDCGLSQRIDEGPHHTPIPVAMARSVMGVPVNAPYNLADMAQDVVGLLDSLSIDKAHVAGASLGGMVAQVLAARWPMRVMSLASIMSSSGNPFVAMARPRALSAILHRPDNPKDPASVTEHLVHVMGVIGSPGFPADAVALRGLCERAAKRGYDTRGTARQMLAMLDSGDRRRELDTIRVPTLVIHGTDDPLVPKAAGREVARHVPGAKLLEFDGMGHDLPAALIPQIVAAIVQHCRAARQDNGAR